MRVRLFGAPARSGARVLAVAVGLAAGNASAQGYGGGLIEFLVTGQAAGARPTAYRANPLGRGDGTLPGHPAAYGYGGPGTYNPYDGDPLPAAMPAPRGPRPAAYASAPEPGYAPAQEAIRRGPDPQFLRQEVAYAGPQAPGTIVVDTPSRHLYLVQAGGRAIRYGIGVGRPGFSWAGLKTVSAKREWPDWTPPAEMLQRRPDLPRHMTGGPQNPLGARALYLGSSLYRIHGTNEPHTIGQAVSSGCIRMMNEDVIDLFERVPVGTRVVVI
ncbi:MULTISPECIES: L,D-transpeptidase [Methylobacterium]|uniref:L,D-transpeptidase n=1 Tax=Methylobacterium TaxID=407 RepID=UPI000CBCFA1E|nr:MAG: hypothetical protein COT56_19735 [Methylobacterium sp. CG09_land_8_20_14_0_10_71_15]PIU12761.1 MAG: hypothetical protein COT28_13875 [Methylobacterium sp. CG08_land_8_20_14_0_20_71_15]